MHISGFAFSKHNVSARTLWRLKNINSCYQVFARASIEKYLEHLQLEKPTHILGLGIYTGKETDKVRIETRCNNRFKGEIINVENKGFDSLKQETLEINPFLKPGDKSLYADSMGEYYCNMASFLIMKAITFGKLKAKYCFLHIPKSMPADTAIKEIDTMIEKFKEDQ